MKKKLFSFILAVCLIIPCAFMLTACGPEEKADPKLYHLTLVYDDEVKNLAGFNQSDLKATYGYGSQRYTEFPETPAQRDEDEIEALKDAGATQEDIDKAGQRQQDGSYYFFDGDPIYLNASKVAGWKLKGFFATTNNTSYPDHKTDLTDIDGEQALPRWNMDNKDVTLIAKYEKLSYSIDFNMNDDDTNPNTITRYCPVDDGFDKTIAPATSSNEHKTFKGWEYQDYSSNNGQWIMLEEKNGNYLLPDDYTADYMRIAPVWEIDQYTITFNFELYVDPDTSISLSFDEAVESILVHGNISTVNDVPVYCETQQPQTVYEKNDELKIEYGSWLNVFYTLNPQYEIFYFKLNGERNDSINASQMTNPYVSLSQNTIKEDSVITFVLSEIVD